MKERLRVQQCNDLTEKADRIVDLFRSIHKGFRSHMIKQVGDFGFTVPQMLLMHELYHNPGISLNELSKKLSLSKSTVSGIVDRLEKQGYVKREIPEDNRRMVKISLTEKIIGEHSKFKDIKTKYLADTLGKIDVEEINTILQSLEKVDELLKEK